MHRSAAADGRVRNPRAWVAGEWELLALVALAALVYQPWAAAALPILDFSEFLPQLAAQTSPWGQYEAVARYMESQGRFCPLLYAHVVVAWNAFGMWAPGWHWTYLVLNVAVLVTGRRLLIELGVGRAAAFAALALWVIAPSVAAGSVRLTGEVTGLVFLIAALRLAHNYADASDWQRRAVWIAACAVGMIAAKEMLAVLLPVIWLMTRLRHSDGKWQWARWSRRDSVVTAWSAASSFIVLLPVALVALAAPAGNYAARYGTVRVGLDAVILRLETAVLPSRAGLPGAAQFVNDAGWQSWLALPNLLWLAVFTAGFLMLWRTRSDRHVRWPLLVAALWTLSGVVAYLPWPSQAPFYMLPFSFGVSIAAAHLLHVLFESRALRIPAASAVLCIAAIGAVEAHDTVREHDLRVVTDVKVISAIAQRGRSLPLVAAVPDPMPPGAYGWGRKLGDYGRASGEIAPLYARDVSCAEGRRLLANAARIVVVSGSNGCGQLAPRSVVVSEVVPRRRWPWLFDGRTNRRIAFVKLGGERLVSSATK